MVAPPEDEFDERNTAVEEDESDESGVAADTVFVEPRRWSWADLAYVSSGLVFNVSHCVTTFIGLVTDQIGAHVAYKRFHVDFAEDVLNDINKL